MLDLGWQEFVMVGLVLILVVGPKDMPRVLKAFTRTVGKMRSLAREFQASMVEVANKEEFREVKEALNDVQRDVKQNSIDALAEFENTKNSYVPGFDSEIKDIQDAAEEFKTEVKKATPKKKTKKASKSRRS